MLNFVKKEPVLIISGVFALISAFIIPIDPQYINYINFRVLCLLFSLMSVVAGLSKLKIFEMIAEKTASKCRNTREIIIILVFICFFSSMLITNDVALITFVPLAISVLTITNNQKYIIYTVIMQTVAANMGSMLTPMGNPQNLYLYDFYNLSPGEFFGLTVPICILSGILIFILCLPVKNNVIEYSDNKGEYTFNKKLLVLYIILGVISILSVFNIVNYFLLTAITLIFLIIFDRQTLKNIDWFLLLTFVMFFIFVGNAARIEFIRNFFEGITQGRELIVGAAASQIISNVPAAVMLSSFTDNGAGLLLGVDIGGLGTPVASLASLISYRIYSATDGCRKGRYMLWFLGINFALLLVIAGAALVWQIWV